MTDLVTEPATSVLPTVRRRPPRGRRGLAAAADTIGIAAEDLRAALHRGETIAEVAEANGVGTEQVIDALLAEFDLRLHAEVAAGRISAADATVLRDTAPRGFVALITGITTS